MLKRQDESILLPLPAGLNNPSSALRRDIFTDYQEVTFKEAFRAHSNIIRSDAILEAKRIFYAMTTRYD